MAPIAQQDTESNLVVIRASRLESLVGPLMDLLASDLPSDILAPQTVIAAHAGMKQWLMGAMARHAGPDGIVANLNVLLPSTWLDQAAHACLDETAVSLPVWQRGALRWAIHDVLEPGHVVAGLSDVRVASYLDPEAGFSDAELARRRFQLADRLAGIYSQYFVYRPDWLRAWESGKHHAAAGHRGDPRLSRLESELLAPLWQHLARHLGRHRAQVMRDVVGALERHAGALEPIHVFGLSHMPPADWQVFQAWARRAPVFLYVPDPCREYWGGLSREDSPATLAHWSEAETRRIEDSNGGEWLDAEQHHPLLARWGRLGQHFIAELASSGALRDIRHGRDDQPEEPSDLLGHLQESIRQLNRPLLSEARATTTDPSLRVHSCHTPLRELEVLRDALLDAVESGIAPGNMVVMAPNLSVYAPMLPSVFGTPGDARNRQLPWHLADAPLVGSHRLFSVFARLLGLGHSRVTTPEIVDLLSVPEIAAALGLDVGDMEAVTAWLQASHVAWGLDARHKEAFAVPPSAEHTMAWGADRMIASYVMSESSSTTAERAFDLPDGSKLLPIPGIHGPSAGALGALDRLFSELEQWRDLARSSFPASQWSEKLQQRLEALLRVDSKDAGATAARSAIGQLVARIALEPQVADKDPTLHFATVQELLLEGLGGIPENQKFLMGGVTFCGMVPQRAIPFEVVCVIGLNDGDFPRQKPDGGLDLMNALPRMGDRGVRVDDRWLFLETVMSARRRLHLSYLGQGVRDGKPRNPASPLAELLEELDQTVAAGNDAMPDRPWVVRHPLQPFDARYFDGSDPRLFSYSAAFGKLHGEKAATVRPFLATVDSPLPADPLPDPLPLASLLRFYRRPAEDLLANRLKLDLSALDEGAFPDSEPLDETLGRIHSVAQDVFFRDALPMGFDDDSPRWSETVIPDRIAYSGLMPPGDLGERAWKKEAEAVTELLHAVRANLSPGMQETSVAIDVTVPSPHPDSNGEGLRIRGTIRNVFRNEHAPDEGYRLVRPFTSPPGLKKAAELDFGQRMTLFIEWALMRLQTVGAERADSVPPAVCLVVLADKLEKLDLLQQLHAWELAYVNQADQRQAMIDDLRSRLGELVRLAWQASSQPPLYFPKTSLKAYEGSTKSIDEASKKAIATFEDGFNTTGERNYAPGWTRLYANGVGFDPRNRPSADDDLFALLDYARHLTRLITLNIPEDPAHG